MSRFSAHELIIGKAFSSIRRPIGIHTIHLADHAVFGEAVDDRDIVRELRLAKLREGWKFSFSLRGHTQAQQRFAARQEPVEGAGPPPFGGLPFGGAAIFRQRRLRLLALPAERAPLVNGMERVDEHHHAGERQSARDRAAAKALDQRGFASVPQAPLSRARTRAWRSRLRSWADHKAARADKPTPDAALAPRPAATYRSRVRKSAVSLSLRE